MKGLWILRIEDFMVDPLRGKYVVWILDLFGRKDKVGNFILPNRIPSPYLSLGTLGIE